MCEKAYLGQLSTKQLIKVPSCHYFFIYLSEKIEISLRKISLQKISKSLIVVFCFLFFSLFYCVVLGGFEKF